MPIDLARFRYLCEPAQGVDRYFALQAELPALLDEVEKLREELAQVSRVTHLIDREREVFREDRDRLAGILEVIACWADRRAKGGA